MNKQTNETQKLKQLGVSFERHNDVQKYKNRKYRLISIKLNPDITRYDAIFFKICVELNKLGFYLTYQRNDTKTDIISNFKGGLRFTKRINL